MHYTIYKKSFGCPYRVRFITSRARARPMRLAGSCSGVAATTRAGTKAAHAGAADFLPAQPAHMAGAAAKHGVTGRDPGAAGNAEGCSLVRGRYPD